MNWQGFGLGFSWLAISAVGEAWGTGPEAEERASLNRVGENERLAPSCLQGSERCQMSALCSQEIHVLDLLEGQSSVHFSLVQLRKGLHTGSVSFSNVLAEGFCLPPTVQSHSSSSLLGGAVQELSKYHKVKSVACESPWKKTAEEREAPTHFI